MTGVTVSDIPITQVLKEKTNPSGKGDIRWARFAADGLNNMIEDETSKIVDPISDKGVQNSKFKPV